MDTSAITASLGRLRTKVRALFLANGLTRCSLVISAYCIVTFLLDYVLGLGFPVPVRLVLLLSAAGTLAYFVYRYLWFPVTYGMSDDELAKCVERGYPMLGDRLISSLQLARTAQNDPYSSKEMVSVLVAETNGLVRSINFRRVANAASLILWMLGASVLVVVIGIFCVKVEKLPFAWFQRYVLVADVEWPRRTTVELISMNGYGDLEKSTWGELKTTEERKAKAEALQVARKKRESFHGKNLKSPVLVAAEGSDVVIKFDTRVKSGEQPDEATVVWQSKDGGEQSKRVTRPSKDKYGKEQPFEYIFEDRKRTFTFYIKAGDSRTKHEYKVEIVRRPEVKGNPEVTVMLPEYMQRVKRAREAYAKRFGGYVRDLPLGSKVGIRIKPIDDVGADNVFIQLYKDGKAGKRYLMQKEDGGKSFSHDLDPGVTDGSFKYSIVMTKKYNGGVAPPKVENADRDIQYAITARSDKAPVVTIEYPMGRRAVTTRAQLPIVAKVVDDLELQKIVLRYAIAKKGLNNLDELVWQERVIREFSFPKDPESGEYPIYRSVTARYRLELTDAKAAKTLSEEERSKRILVEVGDFVIYQIVALDRYQRSADRQKEAYEAAAARAAENDDDVRKAAATPGGENKIVLPKKIDLRVVRMTIRKLKDMIDAKREKANKEVDPDKEEAAEKPAEDAASKESPADDPLVRAVKDLNRVLPDYRDAHKKYLDWRRRLGPNEGLSKVKTMQVLNNRDMMLLLLEALYALQNDLERLKEEQESTLRRVGSIFDSAEAFRSRLGTISQDEDRQHAVAKRLLSIAGSFSELTKQMGEAGLFVSDGGIIDKIRHGVPYDPKKDGDEPDLGSARAIGVIAKLKKIAREPAAGAARGVGELKLAIRNLTPKKMEAFLNWKPGAPVDEENKKAIERILGKRIEVNRNQNNVLVGINEVLNLLPPAVPDLIEVIRKLDALDRMLERIVENQRKKDEEAARKKKRTE